MAVFMKPFLYALVISLAALIGTSYKYSANCVSGDIVAGLEQTGGRIGLYVMALQTLLPIYGNLVLMAQGPNDQCGTAANAVNLNQVKPHDISNHFTDMKQIGALQAMKLANASGKISYLYVFLAKTFIEYEEIADCVPGPIVGGLNQTGGRIALYTMALHTIIPGLFGDLLYLGQGNNSACIDMMDNINLGNQSIVNMKKKGAEFGMKEMGVLQGLSLADNEKSYLYVFKNKMWNNSWQVMLPGLQSYGLPDDFIMSQKSL